jgi:hypothetical protein
LIPHDIGAIHGGRIRRESLVAVQDAQRGLLEESVGKWPGLGRAVLRLAARIHVLLLFSRVRRFVGGGKPDQIPRPFLLKEGRPCPQNKKPLEPFEGLTLPA